MKHEEYKQKLDKLRGVVLTYKSMLETEGSKKQVIYIPYVK